MRTLRCGAPGFQTDLEAFCRTASAPRDLQEGVASILADVRQRGDEAVSYYAAKFDGAKLRSRDFRLKPEELEKATKALTANEKKAITTAHENIVAFHKTTLPKNWLGKNKHGACVGENFYPIRRVGLYVPGGQVPLVSTVLMTATLAKLAGCPEIAVFTPSNGEGKVSSHLLAALHMLGIEEVYRVGGVHAIAAMAYGTLTVPAVDKVFGPGNAYVCEAKRQVYGHVGVDGLPGPSEVMVIVDETARVDLAAADLLAQAEHGSGKEKIYLVATSQDLILQIQLQINSQVKFLSRGERILNVLRDGCLAIEAPKVDDIVHVANYVAPEHLELMVKETTQRRLLRDITTAGAMLLGSDTGAALGDFVAGPSHVLPTGRSGRFASGLRLTDFLRRTSIVQYTKPAVKKAEPTVSAFAAMEQLDAHGRSVKIRAL